MPIATSPFSMNNVSITLGVEGSPVVEYRCQLQRAELVPSTSTGGGGGTDYETFCTTHPGSGATAGTSSWTLELSGFQAYQDATDLANLLFDHEGEILNYVLLPTGGDVGPTNPRFLGQVTASPTQIGGSANAFAQFTVSLTCTEKPTKDVNPILEDAFA